MSFKFENALDEMRKHGFEVAAQYFPDPQGGISAEVTVRYGTLGQSKVVIQDYMMDQDRTCKILQRAMDEARFPCHVYHQDGDDIWLDEKDPIVKLDVSEHAGHPKGTFCLSCIRRVKGVLEAAEEFLKDHKRSVAEWVLTRERDAKVQ